MVSTFTPNIQLEEPARGDDVGTWDTPVNSNMTVIDLVVGANATIGVGSGNVTLSAAQFRSAALIFNSTLIQNTTITFPSTFTKLYTALHTATASSGFTITLATTVSGGQAVAIPPSQGVQVYNDGTNIKFTGGLLPVGAYWDYAGSSVPNWVVGCTVPPYLNCDGTTFASSTYPALAVILGSSILPDRRGTTGATLNQGTARITSAVSGLDGNTRFSVGGDQNLTSHSHTGVTNSVQPTVNLGAQRAVAVAFGAVADPIPTTGANINVYASDKFAAVDAIQHSFTSSAAGTGAAQNMPPTTITGIVMLRAG